MKLTIKKEVEVTGWTLRAYLGEIDRHWGVDKLFEFNNKNYTSIKEFKEDYPQLVMTQPPYYASDPKEGRDTIVLDIDLETGIIKNWPAGVEHEFYGIKIVNTGRWEILDENGKLVGGKTDYVPNCIGSDGWGDYLEFEVADDGHNVNWDFSQEDFDEIIGAEED